MESALDLMLLPSAADDDTMLLDGVELLLLQESFRAGKSNGDGVTTVEDDDDDMDMDIADDGVESLPLLGQWHSSAPSSCDLVGLRLPSSSHQIASAAATAESRDSFANEAAQRRRQRGPAAAQQQQQPIISTRPPPSTAPPSSPSEGEEEEELTLRRRRLEASMRRSGETRGRLFGGGSLSPSASPDTINVTAAAAGTRGGGAQSARTASAPPALLSREIRAFREEWVKNNRTAQQQRQKPRAPAQQQPETSMTPPTPPPAAAAPAPAAPLAPSQAYLRLPGFLAGDLKTLTAGLERSRALVRRHGSLRLGS